MKIYINYSPEAFNNFSKAQDKQCVQSLHSALSSDVQGYVNSSEDSCSAD